MKKFLCLLLSVLLLVQLPVVLAAEEEAVPYDWGILPIGAGGFITGMVFHPTEPDLIYARTDVGGAYRWNADTKTWTNICDVFTTSEWNFYGIDGIAIDPNNPDVVYIAAGKYSYAEGDVLKSTDRGATWERTNLNKRFGGNENNRALGECIMVDPLNSNIIYCGTPSEGLWKSVDGAKTWSKVTDIAVADDKSNQVRNVLFASKNGAETVSKTIYAGVTNVGIYRSQDGGKSWALIPDSPKTPKRMDVGNEGTLFVASTTGLFRFEQETWTEISPPELEGKMHNGISVDPKNQDVLICVTTNENVMKLPMYLSMDGGKTWVNKWETSKHTPPFPWNENDDTFSSNTHCILFNPHDTNQVWFADWHGIYMTEDIHAEEGQNWVSPVQGIEEMVPFDAACPPSGNYRLLTGLADNDGMPYTDIDKFPTRKLTAKEGRILPWMMSTTEVDFCEEDPSIVFRVGVDWNLHGKVELSTDGTETWKFITEGLQVDENGNPKPYGRSAISATRSTQTGNPSLMMIPVAGKPVVSFDMGDTWNEVKGFEGVEDIIPAYWTRHVPLASDRVNGSRFYMLAHNQVYVSNDWGASFEPTVTLQGDKMRMMLKAAPYLEGDVWAGCYKDGLYRSVDGAQTFAKIDGVDTVVSFGFGKEAPGRSNPTVYLFGTVNGAEGMYRSIDMGATWQLISNEKATLGNLPNVVEGDRQAFGVVYVGSDGRGFYVGRESGRSIAPQAGVKSANATITYNAQKVAFANNPIVSGGVLMVPVREFVAYFGATVSWQEQTKTAYIVRPELKVDKTGQSANGRVVDRTATVTQGSFRMNGNGTDLIAAKPATVINGRLYAPVVDLAKAMGATVQWNAAMDTCTILDPVLVKYEANE